MKALLLVLVLVLVGVGVPLMRYHFQTEDTPVRTPNPRMLELEQHIRDGTYAEWKKAEREARIESGRPRMEAMGYGLVYTDFSALPYGNMTVPYYTWELKDEQGKGVKPKVR